MGRNGGRLKVRGRRIPSSAAPRSLAKEVRPDALWGACASASSVRAVVGHYTRQARPAGVTNVPGGGGDVAREIGQPHLDEEGHGLFDLRAGDDDRVVGAAGRIGRVVSVLKARSETNSSAVFKVKFSDGARPGTPAPT